MPQELRAVLSPAEPVPRVGAALVVDVIRATTTAAALLTAGARELVWVGSVEEARAEAQRRGALLAGERGGVPPAGFDLGNSPVAPGAAKVAGRVVVMTTTNGTRAALRAAAAAETLGLAALVNATAAARWLLAFEGEVAIVAAGREGRLAFDDVYTLGALAARLVALAPELELDEGARVALALYRSHPDPRTALRESAAARALEPVGLAGDVEACAREDRVALVPALAAREGGALRFLPVYPEEV
ncbi:MAG TPA: 2-phosphosulfolactate phosphatase [Oceanithermus profundus]|uniref:Probable 2-phosphosulfolactate phosphatase n=1 Tax=Oceanithermus profundus TaxID=187137 RepID=A0A7C4ZI67_9DEIN|nr:2-phosphosulfolactate phosphatase [Oceanithermus profundus]